MELRDEHDRGVADRGRQDDGPLPAAGNYRSLVEGPAADRLHRRARVGIAEPVRQPADLGRARVHARGLGVEPRLLPRHPAPGRPRARRRGDRPHALDRDPVADRVPRAPSRRPCRVAARRGRAGVGRGRHAALHPGLHAGRHRAQALAGPRIGTGGPARVHRDGRGPAARARSHRALRRGALRGRPARLHPAARPRGDAPASRCGAEPAAVLEGCGRRHRDRPEGRVVRHRGLPARAGQRLEHLDRSALGGLCRARRAGVAARLLVDAVLRDRRRTARNVRALLPRAARVRRERHRPRRARHAPRRPRDRALALRRRRARERGSLPGSLRERERAHRHRDDGRDDHRRQSRLRARARLRPRRADRHEPRRVPHPAGARRCEAGNRAQALGRRRGDDLRAGVHREERAARGARGVEPRDRGGRAPDRRAGDLSRHHGAQAGR